MGEEVQKPEETKKPEEEPAKPAGEEKKEDESKDPPPPQPPAEIVLRVFMHCEGCARKVRRCLKGFNGVEDVKTDCKTHKVVVKGEKADPLQVFERVQKKSHRKVELLSPVPKPPAADEPKVVEEKEPPKPEEKKEEPPQVITVVLKVNMHCEACAQEIRKRILRMKGVESADPDLKSSQVTVKGTFPAPELVDYVYKRTGKHAVIVKQDPEPKKDDDGKDKDEKKDAGAGNDKKEDKKADDVGGGGGGGGGDVKDKDKEKEKEKDGGDDEQEKAEAPATGGAEDDMKVVELRKNEFYYYHPQNYQVYPPRYAAETSYGYPPAPQMFSDENPHACSVM